MVDPVSYQGGVKKGMIRSLTTASETILIELIRQHVADKSGPRLALRRGDKCTVAAPQVGDLVRECGERGGATHHSLGVDPLATPSSELKLPGSQSLGRSLLGITDVNASPADDRVAKRLPEGLVCRCGIG